MGSKPLPLARILQANHLIPSAVTVPKSSPGRRRLKVTNEMWGKMCKGSHEQDCQEKDMSINDCACY